MLKIPKIIFIGFTNIDINITPSSKKIDMGGGGYFGAIVASLFLPDVGLVTRIGHDYDPTFLLTRVLPEGVHQISSKPNGRSTQIYHSETNRADRDIEVEWGVNPDLQPSDIPQSWLASATHVHISTMPPLQQKLFIEYLRKKSPHASISLDTDSFFFSEKQNVSDILENFACVDLGFMNRIEYAELKSVGARIPELLVKLDEEDVEYHEYGEKKLKLSTEKVSAVDTTEAGDIFAGAFLAQRVEGKSVEKSLELATKTATISVTQNGVKHLFI